MFTSIRNWWKQFKVARQRKTETAQVPEFRNIPGLGNPYLGSFPTHANIAGDFTDLYGSGYTVTAPQEQTQNIAVTATGALQLLREMDTTRLARSHGTLIYDTEAYFRSGILNTGMGYVNYTGTAPPWQTFFENPVPTEPGPYVKQKKFKRNLPKWW